MPLALGVKTLIWEKREEKVWKKTTEEREGKEEVLNDLPVFFTPRG